MAFKKRKKNHVSVFYVFSVAAATAVTAFILIAMCFIVVKGIPYIPEAVHSDEVKFAIGLSIKTALISTVICMALGIPAAYALTRKRFVLSKVYNMIIELPLSVPNIMLGLSLLLMFSSIPGKALSAYGFKVIFNVNGIIIAHILVNLPFIIRMMRTAFMNIDPRYEIIAGSLGAGHLKTFILITLPLVKNYMIGAGVLAWSRALGEFGATLMLVGATRMKTETLPTSIYLNMATGDTGPAMACAMILLFISAVSLFITNKLNRSPGEHNDDMRR